MIYWYFHIYSLKGTTQNSLFFYVYIAIMLLEMKSNLFDTWNTWNLRWFLLLQNLYINLTTHLLIFNINIVISKIIYIDFTNYFLEIFCQNFDFEPGIGGKRIKDLFWVILNVCLYATKNWNLMKCSTHTFIKERVKNLAVVSRKKIIEKLNKLF